MPIAEPAESTYEWCSVTIDGIHRENTEISPTAFSMVTYCEECGFEFSSKWVGLAGTDAALGIRPE